MRLSDEDYQRALLASYLAAGDSSLNNNPPDFDRAIGQYTQAINILGDADWRPYLNRGIAYGGLQNYAAALSDFKKVLELDSGSIQALLNIGITQKNLGNYAEAIRVYTHIINITTVDNPDHWRAYCNRGVARLSEGDALGAIADFNAFIPQRPDHDLARKMRGIAFLIWSAEATDQDEKGEILTKAIEDLGFYLEIEQNQQDQQALQSLEGAREQLVSLRPCSLRR